MSLPNLSAIDEVIIREIRISVTKNVKEKFKEDACFCVSWPRFENNNRLNI